jgi:hypothetical protein
MREYAWDEGKARRVLSAYRQFLGIKKIYQDYDDEALSPSPSVDLMWQQHILDVVNYVNDCVLLCGGRVVGRNPDGAHEGQEARDERRRATTGALLEHYWDEIGLEYEEWKELFQNPTASDYMETPNPYNETTIQLRIVDLFGRKYTVRVPPTTGRLSDVVALMAVHQGCLPYMVRYVAKKIGCIHNFLDASPSSLGMTNETILHQIRVAPLDRQVRFSPRLKDW